MKVMISQPMNGLLESEIQKRKIEAESYLLKQGHVVVNTLFSDEWYEQNNVSSKNNIPLFFFSKSLEKMADCDAVYFLKGWENARGCRLEHQVAEAYGLNIMEEE